MRTLPFAFATLSMLVAGCATIEPPVNEALKSPGDAQAGYTFENWIDQRAGKLPKDIVILTFSGGGSRAAALASGVLGKLKEDGLTDQIVLISSTSGGSVAAAHYAATGDQGIDSLRTDFLALDNTAELTKKFVPGFFTRLDRSRAFSEYLDQKILNIARPVGKERLTFGDLKQRWDKAPFIILNATDASSGNTFEFTQNSFSNLCSDLASYPVAEAIAASAAVPVVMTSIPLKNNWIDPNCREKINPYSEKDFVNAEKAKYINLDAFIKARFVHSLRHSFPDPRPSDLPAPYRRIEYLHLLDGGLSDNLGSRSLTRAFTENVVGKLLKENVERILLIQVNAKSESFHEFDLSEKGPSFGQTIGSVTLNPIDVATSLSSHISKVFWQDLVEHLKQKNREGQWGTFELFPVQVDFDQMPTTSDEERNRQRMLKNIGTNWRLKPGELEALMTEGRSLLANHPCFRAFQNRERCAGSPDLLAAYPMPAPAPTQAPPREISSFIELSAVQLFDTGKAVIMDEARAELQSALMRAGSDGAILRSLDVTLDERDLTRLPAAKRTILAARRQQAVRKFLQDLGVDDSMIQVHNMTEQADTKGGQRRGIPRAKVSIHLSVRD